jgi:hypothetical protein
MQRLVPGGNATLVLLLTAAFGGLPLDYHQPAHD